MLPGILGRVIVRHGGEDNIVGRNRCRQHRASLRLLNEVEAQQGKCEQQGKDATKFHDAKSKSFTASTQGHSSR